MSRNGFSWLDHTASCLLILGRQHYGKSAWWPTQILHSQPQMAADPQCVSSTGDESPMPPSNHQATLPFFNPSDNLNVATHPGLSPLG